MAKTNYSVFDLGNSLAVENVKRLRVRFDKLIVKKPTLRIVSSSIKEIDLTGIQLIRYFHLRAATLGKKIILNLTMNEDQKNLVIRNGFSNLTETTNP